MKFTINQSTAHRVLIIVAGAMLATTGPLQAGGLLRVHPTNPRYLTDDSGKGLHFAGPDSYHLINRDFTGPQPPHDFTGTTNYFKEFLDYYEPTGVNFIRMWPGMSYLDYSQPGTYEGLMPWQRTGPGTATDGKPKFNMESFDEAYFDKVRAYLQEIQDRGMYCSIMLFGSDNRWSSDFDESAWAENNNINAALAAAFTSEPISFFTQNTAAQDVQKATIRKFVDEFNDLDCIIWEIINEPPGTTAVRDWEYDMIEYLRSYESGKPKQHLIGMTAGGYNTTPWSHLDGSPADWVQPGSYESFEPVWKLEGGPPDYTNKVVFCDTDHIYPWYHQYNADAKAIQVWVWKTFLRGHYPQMLDMFKHGENADQIPGVVNTNYNIVRHALGDTVAWSKKFADLAAATPTTNTALCSTGYHLRNEAGLEFLAFRSNSGSITINLPAGDYAAETLDTADGSTGTTNLTGHAGGNYIFAKPAHVAADWAIFLHGGGLTDWLNDDIPTTLAPPGTAGYDAGTDTFTVEGAGADIWGTSDQFHFVDREQQLVGDGRITAKVTSIENTHAWAKAGLMVRESLAANSRHATVLLSPTLANGMRLQYRTITGGTSYSTPDINNATAPYWLRLERNGDTFTGLCSPDGSSWTTVGSANVVMANDVHIGMAVTSHRAGNLCTATFQNVIVEGLAPTPVGWWKFNESSGTNAIDSSGNNYTLAVYDAVWTAGQYDNCVDFDDDATPSYATRLSAPSLLKPTNELAVCAWVRCATNDVDTSGSDIVTMGDNYVLRIKTDGKVRFQWYGGGSWKILDTAAAVSGSPAVWHHLVGQKTANGMQIYIDGILSVTNALTGTIGYSRGPNFYVGKNGYGSNPGSNYDYFGRVDDVRVYGTALSAAEIDAVRNNQ